MQRILGQLLRSLLQNPRNFSEVALEVRPAVHTALLSLTGARNPRMKSIGPLRGVFFFFFFHFCLVRNPAELDSVTEIEGQTRSSAWCRGLTWAS